MLNFGTFFGAEPQRERERVSVVSSLLLLLRPCQVYLYGLRRGLFGIFVFRCDSVLTGFLHFYEN